MGPGDVVAERFEIQALAGSGGMGFVYRARDRQTGELVALKMLRGERVSDGDRFAREAQVLSALRHPGIVRYVDHGTAQGAPYLAMEWLRGENLSDRLSNGPLSVRDAVVVLARTAEGLGFAHQRGVVHRDLKPSNIFLCDGAIDRVKLLDFGIARRPHEEQLLTRTGAMLGTPGYMSPEQARGSRDIDARTDVFSLGCVLFKCLTGRVPFDGHDALTVLVKVMLEEVPPIGTLREDVPEPLEVLLSQMLSKSPVSRPRDASAVAEELRLLESQADRPSLTPHQPQSLTTREERVSSMVFIAPPLPVRMETITNAGDRQHPMHAAVRTAVERLGGELEILADGSILVTTGASGVATDEAARAARCALAVRTLIPQARIAIVAGSRATTGAAIGRAIEHGVLLLRRAEDDRIRIDDSIAGLLDARFEIGGDEQGLELRAEAGSEQARTLLGRPSPCVGRERELAVLEAIWDDCLSEARASAAVVMGPAGVGKSRLRQELATRLRQRGARIEVWSARGDPLSAGSAFGLAAQTVRDAAGLREGEPVAVIQQKVRARLSRRVAADALHRVTVFLSELVGARAPEGSEPLLDAARQNAMLMGDQIRRAFLDFLSAVAAEAPVLLVLENLQWGDHPSLKLLDAALRDLVNRPLMVLGLARPEVREVFPKLWEERSPQQIRLGELSRKASEKLAREMLGDAVDADTLERIVTQAAGNAFYLEELIRSEVEGKGQVVPGSVLAMVQARIEGLETEARRVLRAASVFGDVFWRGGVRALVGEEREAQMGAWLSELVARELVTQRPVSKFADQEAYAFRHSILREAAYAMLTDRDRKVGHRLAGEWLERTGETDPMILAEHFERGESPARAAHWFERAALAAFEANDFSGVLARVQSGYACEPRGEQRGSLKLLEARAFGNRGETVAAEAAAMEAMHELPRETSLWYGAGRVISIATLSLGEEDRLLKLASELVVLPVARGAAAAQVRAWATAARSLAWAGHAKQSDALLARIDEVGTVEGFAVACEVAHARGIRALYQGDAFGYLQAFGAAREQERSAGDERAAAADGIEIGMAYLELGDLERGIQVLREGCAELERMGLAGHVATATVNLGYGLALADQPAEGAACIERALRSLSALGHVRFVGQARALLSRVRLLQGLPERALEEGLGAAQDASTSPMFRAHGTANAARALLVMGKPAEALERAREAMKVVEALGSIGPGEASARLVFAESLRAQGDRDSARQAMEAARKRLLERARPIRDERLRTSFLTRSVDVPETLALHEQWTGARG